METGKIEISDSDRVSLRLAVLEVTVDELVADVCKLQGEICDLRQGAASNKER